MSIYFKRLIFSILLLFWVTLRVSHAGELDGLHKQTLSERIRIIQRFQHQLVEKEKLLQMLRWVNDVSDYSNLSPSQKNLFYNALLETLCSVKGLSPDVLVARFTQCIQDPSQSLVHRDYAMQHLGHFYKERTLPRESVEVLFELCESENRQLASTALRTLESIVEEQRSMDVERLKKLVLDHIEAPPGRVEAAFLHAVATLDLEEALPAVREIAFSLDASLTTQIVAFYVLGELGTGEDFIQLRQLQGLSPRGTFALKAAILKLEKRKRI